MNISRLFGLSVLAAINVCSMAMMFPRGLNSYSGINFLFGSCSVPEYYQGATQCRRTFFDSVRVERAKSENCSFLYQELKVCMLHVFNNCLKNSLLESYLFVYEQRGEVENNYLTFLGDENRWCKHGGIGSPSVVHHGTNCDPIYPHVSKDCVALYQLAFNSNVSQRRLCREYNRAELCLFRSTIKHCSFTNRPLSQMMRLLVEMELSYQPYCQNPIEHGMMSYYNLSASMVCPPRSHADVLFLADVSDSTDAGAFESMKELIRNVVGKLSYGMNGIRAGFAQFNDQVTMSIRLNRYPTAKSFLRGLSRTTRTRNGDGSIQNTDRALSWLANNIYDFESNRSAVRPYHTPVCVVMTTGRSSDAIKSVIQLMTRRKVHVIMIGPHLLNSTSSFHSIRTRNRTSYGQYCGEILGQICQTDRDYRRGGNDLGPGSYIFGGNSLLEAINRNFLRFGFTHLPLLWVPKPVVPLYPSGFNGQRYPSNATEFLEEDFVEGEFY